MLAGDDVVLARPDAGELVDMVEDAMAAHAGFEPMTLSR
jgi:hypothetical protein